VATAAGVAAGQATWTIATSAGLAVLLVLSAPLFLDHRHERLAGYAFAVDRVRGWLRLERVRRSLDALLGAVLVGLGVRVGAQALGR